MTWQKVVQSETERSSIKQGDETAGQMATEWVTKGVLVTLESKSGNQYDFEFKGDSTIPTKKAREMGADIAQAMSEGQEVWVSVDFDNDRIEFWADGAPWEGGDVQDDYGLDEGY